MKRPRRKDSGFALLLILLMGAVIAITLYTEIPRIAFESQRQKEQLLIERGEQYKRAIQLFVKANQRWPGRIEDLENFNNRHYLRQRYKDPMTGKDEWRMVHIQNGILTDSVTTKQNANQQQQGSSTLGQYVGVQAGIGEAPINSSGTGRGGANLAMQQRASDRSLANVGQGQIQQEPQVQPDQGEQRLAQAMQQQQQAQQQQGQQEQFPQAPGQQPGTPVPGGYGAFQGMPPQPQPGQTNTYYSPAGQPMNTPFNAGGINPTAIRGNLGNVPTNQPNTNTNTGNTYVGGGGAYVGNSGAYVGGGSYIGSQPNAPAGPFGGQQFNPQLPPQPGAAVNSQTGGVSPYPVTPGANGQMPGYAQPGLNPQQFQQYGTQPRPGQMPVGGPQQQNAAAQMISQILTTPRPGGVPQGVQGGIIGTGIAGVASNSEDDSIMVYNDRTNYGEWEFIFDPLKQKVPPNPLTGAIGNPAAALINQQGLTPGNPAAGGGGVGGGGAGGAGGGGFGSGGAGTGGFGGQPVGQQPSPFGGQPPGMPPARRP